MPLAQFVLGPRRTLREADELLTAVVVPEPLAPLSASAFGKLGSRRFLVISFVMVAVALEADANGRIVRAGVAVGACAPVARRIDLLEAALVGQAVGPGLAECVEPEHFAPLAPIDDVRADTRYRLEAASVLTRRALAAASERLVEASGG